MTGGALLKGSHDPYAKGRLTLVPKVRRPLRKPPPENQKGATGESFRGYRRISFGAEAWSALMLRHGQYRS